MPSGSHAGGRAGSHGGGGAGFGGGSRGGESRRGGSGRGGRPIGPRRFRFFGRHYVIASGPLSVISVLFFFVFFCSMIAFIGHMSKQGNLSAMKDIEVDYVYYQDMIEYAEENPEYMKTATITDIVYNRDCDKWYYTYEIPLTETPLATCKGWTYSIYTREEIRAFKVDMKIQVATNSATVTFSTDSTPIDYKNTTLEDDGEYAQLKNGCITYNLVMWGGVAGVVACVTGIVVTFLTTKKKVEEASVKSKAETTTATETPEYYCEYCGVIVDGRRTKCPSCGARISKKK